jgi:DnaJ-class molecular chaperone
MTAADLKACYDKFDEEGLKGGVPISDGNFLEGYIFHGNSEQIFREFFGGNNPFAGMLCCICTLLRIADYRLLN